MTDERDPLPPNQAGETAQFIFALALAALLFVACCVAPLFAAAWVHPAVGALVAIVAMVVWVYFGPRPSPGFLSGLIAIQGLVALFAIFIVCVIRAIQTWF